MVKVYIDLINGTRLSIYQNWTPEIENTINSFMADFEV